MLDVQPGVARNAEETRTAILNHFLLATQSGGEKPLKEAITASGVKDTLAMTIINMLIATGKELRRATATRSAVPAAEVNQILIDELKKYEGKPVMNALLMMPGPFPLAICHL